jgi:hypothetical protein
MSWILEWKDKFVPGIEDELDPRGVEDELHPRVKR